MNKDLLTQRIADLQRGIEIGASELNKMIGRLDEAKMLLDYINDKEKQQSNDVISEQDKLESPC